MGGQDFMFSFYIGAAAVCMGAVLFKFNVLNFNPYLQFTTTLFSGSGLGIERTPLPDPDRHSGLSDQGPTI